MIYVATTALLQPARAPRVAPEALGAGGSVSLGRTLAQGLFPPLLLIIAVLGSIMGGIATPTEASGVGALGALLLALAQGQLSKQTLGEIVDSTTKTTAMVFFILIGAAVFSLVFRGFGGDELVQGLFEDMPGGVVGATIVVMLVIFLLGFILDFIEITSWWSLSPCAPGHGARPRMARGDDCGESANKLPRPLRLCPILFARRGPDSVATGRLTAGWYPYRHSGAAPGAPGPVAQLTRLPEQLYG